MTIGEWQDKGFIMMWSIFNRQSEEEYEEWRAGNENRIKADPESFTHEEQTAYMAIELDLRAPEGCPDGMFPILHNGIIEGRSAGVLVRNGQFVPDNIAQAAAEAVCASFNTTKNEVITGRKALNHVFIEGFTWIPSLGVLEVHTGS